MEKKKDFYEFVMTVRKATTYIVDENGNEVEQEALQEKAENKFDE